MKWLLLGKKKLTKKIIIQNNPTQTPRANTRPLKRKKRKEKTGDRSVRGVREGGGEKRWKPFDFSPPKKPPRSVLLPSECFEGNPSSHSTEEKALVQRNDSPRRLVRPLSSIRCGVQWLWINVPLRLADGEEGCSVN